MTGPRLAKHTAAIDLDATSGDAAAGASATGGPASRDPSSKARQRMTARVRQVIPLVVLLAVLTGEVVELRARGASQAAYDRLNRAYGAEAESQAIKDEEVRQIVGRSIDEFDPRTGVMIFRWHGALKNYALYVQCARHLHDWYVRDFALNNDPRMGPGR